MYNYYKNRYLKLVNITKYQSGNIHRIGNHNVAAENDCAVR